MSEFELGQHTYRIGKLDAFKQFHLSRKVAPIIPTLIPVFLKLRESRKDAPEAAGNEDAAAPLSGDLSALVGVMTPFTEGIASMPDEAAEFILSTCLSVIQRKQGGTWSPVWSGQQNTCMFDDIDLGMMMKLSTRVVTESLGPFLRGMLTDQGIPKA